jgi:putative transposase
MATGARVLGRRHVLEQSWKDCPTSFRPHRKLRPRFAGTLDVRLPALASYRSFLWAYRYARDRWRRGLDAIFPAGTYWLTRFAHVDVAPA